MKKFKLENFIKGWIIGNFEPNIIKTDKFEFAIKEYKKGDKEVVHFHKKADEISVIISGVFKMNDEILKKGDIVWISPLEVTDFFCLEDGYNAVIKIPSVKNDKYLK
jgi:mannose-6-phosphate isomerase-like protein (cupin superfamily)